MSLRTDLPKAVSAAWLILSAAAGVCVVAPLLLPADAIYGLLPQCEAKARGGSCAACGLTTAFVLLSRGDLNAARQANAASPYLYFGFVANFLAALAYFCLTLLGRRIGDSDTCKWSH